MGIVIRQSFWNTIYTYSGLVIGYVNTVLLFPVMLDPEQFGLTRVLISFTLILAQFAQLGIGNTIVRFFPRFFQPQKKLSNMNDLLGV